MPRGGRRPGGAIQPAIPLDRIEMHVDHPLFTPPDGGDQTAEAD